MFLLLTIALYFSGVIFYTLRVESNMRNLDYGRRSEFLEIKIIEGNSAVKITNKGSYMTTINGLWIIDLENDKHIFEAVNVLISPNQSEILEYTVESTLFYIKVCTLRGNIILSGIVEK